MNLVVMMTCWGRPALTKLVLKQLEKVNEKQKFILVTVLSKEDIHFAELEKAISESKFKTEIVYESNEELGKKHNAGISKTLELNPDYIMNLGSDDFLHENIFELYKPYIDKKLDIIGLNELYFFMYPDNCLFFKYYNKFEAIGAGRLMRTEKIKELDKLYTDEKNRGLDTDSANNLRKVNAVDVVLSGNGFPYIVDVKTLMNINQFDSIVKSENTKNIKKVDCNIVLSNFDILSKNLENLKEMAKELNIHELVDENGDIECVCINNHSEFGKLDYKVGEKFKINAKFAETFIKKGFFEVVDARVKQAKNKKK